MALKDLFLLALAPIAFVALACAPTPPPPSAVAPPPPSAPAPPAARPPDLRRHTLALSDFSDCAIGKEKRVYCWDGKIPPFVLDALPAGEGGARRVAISDRSRDRVCLVSEAGHVFCNEGVHPKDTRLVRVDGVEKAVDISLDAKRACVTTEEGRVLCWGDNALGQLGSGDEKASHRPVDTGMADAVEVSVWSTMTCALARTGRVWCWGAVVQDEPNVLRPKVLEPYTDIRQLGTGDDPCLVHADGRATCWDAYVPSGPSFDAPEWQARRKHAVQPGLADALAITKAKSRFTCAVRRDGTVSCGGLNAFGYLGRGDWKDAEHGKPVLGLTDVVEVEARGGEVCARRASGSIHCWGWIRHRDPAAPLFVATPTVVSGASPSAGVVCSAWHCCSRTLSGGLECWGDERFLADAQLRVPAEHAAGLEDKALDVFIGEPEKMPIEDVVDLGARFVVTRAGGLHGIAPIPGEDGKRWSLKEPVAGLPPVARLVADDPLCFEDKGNKVRCIGSADWRVPSTCKTKSDTPWPPWDPRLALARGAAMVATRLSGCAIDKGTLRCWGATDAKDFGVDVPPKASCDRPFVFGVSVPGAKAPYARLAQGSGTRCVVDADGVLFCVGTNARGQLGRGTKTKDEPRFVRVESLEPVVDVAVAEGTTCAVGRSGKVFCWGRNDWGQLGDGTAGAPRISNDPSALESADRATPGEARAITNAKAITARNAGFCALLADAKIACWGENEHGEVGIGGRGRRYTPRPIEVVEPTQGRPINVAP